MLEYIPIPAIIIGSLAYAWWRKAYLTQVMVIANFLIFLYMLVLALTDNPAWGGLGDAFTFVPARILDPVYLPTIVTSMFMHIDPMHLISNVLILYLIGLPLEERIGTGKWGIIYLASGISGTLMYFMFNTGSETHLLGASGAIFGLGGALLVLYPKDRIPMLLGPIFSMRAPVWAAVGIMFVWETILVFLQVDDGTAHLAHIGGFACGIFLAPAIAKRVKKEKEIALDFELLRQMARKPEDVLMLEKIENETEQDVKFAWLEFFLKEAARCPKCKRQLGEGYAKSGRGKAVPGEKLNCACGQSYDIWK
jgi:membrane associated rhomboid family serine protease